MNASQQNWVALKLLKNRFAANVAALARRDRTLADSLSALVPNAAYHIRVDGDHVFLGSGEPGQITALPTIMSPASAQQTLGALFPHGHYNEPMMLAGEDLGWLLNSLYLLPCKIANAPGYRPPIFFIHKNLERLWIILHVQDWQTLLTDLRVRLFVGDDCVTQFRRSLVEQVMCRWPRLSVDVDPTIWEGGMNFEACYLEGIQQQNAELQRFRSSLEVKYRNTSIHQVAELFASGRPIRVMGITSRYTSFIQYSMRDWLAAFESLGHQTRLLIESADHELPTNLAIALACDSFEPDLVVVIDHFRGELNGLPEQVPVVMWVQDRLPNIYSSEAGKKQGRLDYVIGQSRLELTQKFGYPADRCMPTMLAVNEQRFSPRALSAIDQAKFGCEVSYVSNASTSADEIMRELCAEQPPVGASYLLAIYQRLRAIYDAGGSITSGDILRKLIVQTAAEHGVKTEIDTALDVFTHRVNNALFRHQAIRWVAELGVDLRLYGKGWENNREFAKYARGIADNQNDLATIYQATQINLQIMPFGAVHQRLLEGLTAGGFFLLRSVTADELELILRDMHGWCKKHNVRNGREMLARRDTELMALAWQYNKVGGIDPLSQADYFFGAMDECARSGFTRTANTLWTNAACVTFATRDQLQSQVRHFLAVPDERAQITRSMRERVIQTHTYQGIARRTLAFITEDLKPASRIAAPGVAA